MGEEGVDESGATLQLPFKASKGDRARHGDGEPENCCVQCFGDSHGDAFLSFGGSEHPENIDKPPCCAKDAEHGSDVGYNADDGHSRATLVDEESKARFQHGFQKGGVKVVESENDFPGERQIALLAKMPQLPRCGVSPSAGEDKAAGKKKAVEDSGRHKEGACQQRIPEGSTRVEELLCVL